MFLQEHWLSERRLVDLNVHSQFHMHGLCGFDNSEVLSGRPFGGCAILWRASKFACVEIVHKIAVGCVQYVFAVILGVCC